MGEEFKRAPSLRERVYAVVRDVLPGEVVSYGEVARLCGTIPLWVGKALAACPDDVPWHRVIGADGSLPVAKRGAVYAAEQRRRLEAEGVRFREDGRVDLHPGGKAVGSKQSAVVGGTAIPDRAWTRWEVG